MCVCLYNISGLGPLNRLQGPGLHRNCVLLFGVYREKVTSPRVIGYDVTRSFSSGRVHTAECKKVNFSQKHFVKNQLVNRPYLVKVMKEGFDLCFVALGIDFATFQPLLLLQRWKCLLPRSLCSCFFRQRLGLLRF